jgi:WD40 repeat protein
MSPEQARGAPASRTADVYGLGAALYELLAGAAPDNVGAPPNADALPETVPRELVAIVRRCVQVLPADRYPSAGELAADLGRWLSGDRVRAHEYRPIELLVRLLRAWRIPIGVGAVAMIVLAVVIAVAVQRTRRERTIAEANLAVALNGQALAALLDERLPEAHVLAAHALRYGPSPEARGILAATPIAAAGMVRDLPLPPRCRHGGVVSPDATMLACSAEGMLEIWAINPMEALASLDLNVVEDPVWVGTRLLVATPHSLAWIEEGKVVATIPDASWRPLASGEVAFATRGAAARRVFPDGKLVDFAICTATRSTTLVVDGELVIGCDDGFLRSYGSDGALRLALPLGERPAWSVVHHEEGGLLVGRLDGGVQTLSLPDGAAGTPLSGMSRSVRALQPIRGTPGVLVLGERGGPRIWNTNAGGWAGSLPARASRMFPGPQLGEVFLLGESLQLWRIPAMPRPAVLNFGSGVSHVTPSPSGESLAVALGSGEIVERRFADGGVLRRWSWAEGVAKVVAYMDEDRLLGAAMGAPGRVLGPGEQSLPLDSRHILRRGGRLSDGRVWALAYGESALVIEPNHATISSQLLGFGTVDASSSPSGDTAVLVDASGSVRRLGGDGWSEVARVPDALAVDIGDGGLPLVVARRREVCIDGRCTPVEEDILDIALSGEHIAVASLSGNVLILNAGTGELLALLRGHTARVSSVEFGPGGTWLLSGSWDGTARIWDLADLQQPAETLITRAEQAWGLGLDEAMRAR